MGGVNITGKISTSPNVGEVQSNTGFDLGTAFQDSDVARAVDSMKRLFTSNGLYDADITPSVERDPEAQQVFLTFHVTTGKRAKYEQPVIQGNTLLSNDTILRATGWRIPVIHMWRAVTDARTRGGVSGVLRKYEAQDRLTAKVQLGDLNYEAATRRVQPHLTIDPGPKVKVTAVEAKVSKRIFKRYVPVFQERAVDNDLLETGKRNLQEYFQSQGYYDASVDFREQPAVNGVGDH